ncbi:MAG: PAS domain S-box protein, partial [Victivallales bacterium]
PMHDLAQYLPIGYTYQKLMINHMGQAEDCVFLDINPAFEKISGLKKESIIGKRATEVFARLKTSCSDWFSFFGKTVLSGEAQETTRYVDTFGRWCRVIAYSPEGMHFVAMFQDKTLELRPAEELSRLKNLQAMFDEHTAVMLLTDPLTGKIIDANLSACAFYGYTREELKSMYVEEISPLFKEEMRKRHLDSWNREHRYFLFPHRLKNGEIRMVDVYSSPVHYENQTQCYSIMFDVTDREKYKEVLYNKEELLSITLNSIGDGVVTTNQHGLITSLNKAAQEITGWNDRESRDKDFTEVFQLKNEETKKTVEDPIAKVLQTGKVIGLANHTVLVNKQGDIIPIADSAAPIRDEKGNVFGVVMVFRDVSQDKEQQEQILYLSYHDALTGLYNRRFVMEEMKRLDTARQLPLAVIIGDVNGLKLTNDAFGHAEGDKLLKKVASALKASCREGDIIARWGGDEFLILLPQTPAATVRNVIKRIKRNFDRKSRGTLQISVSLGYAVKEKEDEKMTDILKEAEKWMYHKKLLEGKSYRNNIINTLLAVLYERNIETEEHSKRVEEYCLAVGEKLGLSAEQLNELSLLAMLHDIGKIGINQNILLKPGPLSPEEWEEMRRHSEIGYHIAKNTPELSIVSEYILLHHEHWDGKGYPKGYMGEGIPLPCRILAVADAYDVMINGRVYQEPCGKEEAIAELKQNAGTQFDPQIVNLFVKTICNR